MSVGVQKKLRKEKKVVITIPAYNEEADIARVLDEIHSVMKLTDYNYTILVLDDGSKDKTVEIAKVHGAVVVSHKRNRGLAQTFREEMRQCIAMKADIIVHTDADGQYVATGIPKLIAKVGEGYDLVLGSRFKGSIESMPWLKRFGNKAFSVVLSQLTHVKLTDTTTGFRAFTREIAEEISYINTFTYTQEQIIKAAKQKFRITEIPIEARVTRESRLFSSPLQYAVRAWINIFRIYRDYEPLQFFGRIGGAFVLAGVGVGSWLVYLFILQGKIGRLPSTILTILLILVGLQIILFGFLADMQRE
jgi:glycosyltransferase involved in cell wall biosynthesis